MSFYALLRSLLTTWTTVKLVTFTSLTGDVTPLTSVTLGETNVGADGVETVLRLETSCRLHLTLVIVCNSQLHALP
jgi:hypothetical protein